VDLQGIPEKKKLEATRNDILDLLFAAQATYFDGFITSDAKASWIYGNLEGALGASRRARAALDASSIDPIAPRSTMGLAG
jgi:hypothetical protein